MTLGVWRMAMCRKQVSRQDNQKVISASRMFKTQIVRLSAPVLAIAGCLGMSVPSMAITTSYGNDYRACVGRLKGTDIAEQAISQACATALRPTDLSSCVITIDKKTQITAVDALSGCERARRPKEYATCVVGISLNTQEAINPAVLNYCSRSLLPVRFAQCVVGISSQTSIAPTQLLDTCIDGSDIVGGVVPSSAPPIIQPSGSSPSVETQPIPANEQSK